MAFFKIKQTAWDRIKAAVADAADTVSDRVSDLRDTAGDRLQDGVESAQSTHRAVQKKVRARVSAGTDAVRGGVAAVGQGVSTGVSAVGQGVSTGVAAVGHGVSAVGDAAERTANGVIAGAIAGALASWVMNQYQAVSSNKVEARRKQAAGSGDAQGAAAESGGTAKSAEQGGGDNATVQVAQGVSRNLFGHELAEGEKPAAGTAVHYGYGAAVGALYGGMAELLPGVSVGLGIPFATAVWLLGDELVVPALGMGKPPTQTKPADHAAAFSAHLVYGVTLDIARRVLRHIV